MPALRNPRSSEAYLSLDVLLMSALCRKIVCLIGEAMADGRGGMTTWEIEDVTGKKHQTISSTVSGLYHISKAIRPSGLTRRTDTGRRADVYEIGDPEAADAPIQPGVGSKDRRRRSPLPPPVHEPTLGEMIMAALRLGEKQAKTRTD